MPGSGEMLKALSTEQLTAELATRTNASAGGYSAGAMGGVLVAGLVVGLVAGLFAGRRQKVATQKVASAAGMYGGVEEKEPLTHAL